MRLFLLTCLGLGLTSPSSFAQVGGNANYANQATSQGRSVATQRPRQVVNSELVAPTDTSLLVEANVLINVKADEFVALFGVTAEAPTVAECQTKMDATVTDFRNRLESLGITAEATYVDFAAQTKVYGYKVEGSLARQYQVGFELKKTVSIRYRDKNLLDKLVLAASQTQIFDLIKVDYIVLDPAPIQDRLEEAAAVVIKTKIARHERLLGIKLRPVPRIQVERSNTYFPSEMYSSYTAAESESFDRQYQSSTNVQNVRKSQTFYFNPLNTSGFDRVVEPVILEPVVQFTYHLSLKYEIETRL